MKRRKETSCSRLIFGEAGKERTVDALRLGKAVWLGKYFVMFVARTSKVSEGEPGTVQLLHSSAPVRRAAKVTRNRSGVLRS